MKIFVTGATGFIGNELVTELLNDGHFVVAMFRDPDKIRIPEQDRLTWVSGDLSDTDRLIRLMKGCESVFHLAAHAKVWSKNPDTYMNVNVDGTRNVLEAALRAGVSRVIATSTAGVIGPSDGPPAHEESKRTTGFFSEYERTKYEAEKVMQNYIGKGLTIVTLLPSRLYGPGLLNESNSATVLIQKYIRGTWHLLPGNGKKIGNYVFISDVVRGHINALEPSVPEGRFILGGTDVNYRDFFNTISRVTGQRHWMVPVPSALMIFAASVMFAGARLFGFPPLLTPGWARKYLHNWPLSSTKAMKHLNYSITPFEEGIRKTVNWLNANNDE